MLKVLRSFAVIMLVGGMATACASTSTSESTGQYVDSATITGKVKTALVRDPVTKARQIEVDTYKDVVQLSGFVDSAAEKQRAEQIARSVEGVRDVHNNLIVK
ncbi:MAG TPA: BON domain-containing protein [Ferrovibrio sp.]|uniref:BON domain-containing protein n=1 Tax=Ferrovibrio sp. TaxID=1917215 RepID=UPI002ED08FFE